MTKAQALAAITALEAAQMPGSAVLTFPATGGEMWGIALDPTHVYTGPQLGAIASYCAANGLSLSAQFAALGIV